MNYLINYLETYQKSFNNKIKINLEKNIANNQKIPEENIKIRNFFFEFLLNPDLYREENENILNNLNNLFDLLNRIINDNHYNEELYKDKIFKKIIRFRFIFYHKNIEFKKITKSYISFLSNYINKFYFNSKEGKTIINNLYEMIEEYKNKEEYNLLTFYLSFVLFKSDITFYSD